MIYTPFSKGNGVYFFESATRTWLRVKRTIYSGSLTRTTVQLRTNTPRLCRGGVSPPANKRPAPTIPLFPLKPTFHFQFSIVYFPPTEKIRLTKSPRGVILL
jgi:hypothetical protein